MLSFRRSKESPEVALTITTETFYRLAALVVSLIILISAARKASHALLLIFTAFFLALALNSPVHYLSHKLPGRQRGSRSIATSLSFLIVIVFLGGFLALITPPLAKQTTSFIQAAPTLVRDFRSQDSQTGRFIRHYHLQKQVDTLAHQLSARIQHSGGTAFNTAQKIGTSFFSLLTILVLTFMMLVEGPRWVAFGRELVPDRHHETTDRLVNDMYDVIKGFVNGQVLLAFIAALLITPMLFILNISYPAALIVIIFICGLIPMVGHTIGAVIVTTVALFHSTSSAILILGYYILYQQLENYLVQPRIQANSTNMSPLLVFIAVVIGVSFGGLFGALVAIPVAGCLRIGLLEYLRSQKIIDTPEFERVTTKGTK